MFVQIDIIEYLVHFGADLNAKTKNGETPYDICEDPDLKSRILQLKTEIESKKLVSSSRLRRSHSQNKRTQSIRRTSIREKSQIAKREAIEEARIWHEKIDTDNTKKEDSDLDSETNGNSNNTKAHGPVVDLENINLSMDNGQMYDYRHSPSFNFNGHPHDSNASNRLPMTSVAQADTSDTYTSSVYSQYYDSGYHTDNKQPAMPAGNATNNSYSTLSKPISPDAVKVEIHVTVNASNSNVPNHNTTASGISYNSSTGTLIDLKKQRIEKHRNSLNNTFTDGRKPMDQSTEATVPVNSMALVSNSNKHSLPVFSNTANIPVVHASNYHNHHSKQKHSNSSMHDSPPSPSTFKKKYRGNPSELIGENQKKGCCTIS